MIKNPRRKCAIIGCSDIATHGQAPDKPTLYTNYATHCDHHTPKELQDLHNKPCTKCGLKFLLNINKCCFYCDPDNFEKESKRKEILVKEYFDRQGFKYRSHDTVIDGGICGKERPDFIFDCGTHIIIVEVDENQHFSRPCECEQTRMVNIFQSLGMITVFIRYNPDKYKPVGKDKSVVGDTFDVRMAKLNYWMRAFGSNVPQVPLSVGYLYFDGWDGLDNVYEINC
jgi:hypothetical protein